MMGFLIGRDPEREPGRGGAHRSSSSWAGLTLLVAFLAFSACALADTGVLIPGGRQQPDPAIFSLNEMVLEIRIDNGVARVQVRQVFGNHRSEERRVGKEGR